jgi:hypothetical protein
MRFVVLTLCLGAADVTYNLIVQHLNAQKISAPRSQYWSKTMVHYLLRNRAYLGGRIYNKRSYRAYRRGEKVGLANPKEARSSRLRQKKRRVCASPSGLATGEARRKVVFCILQRR